MEGFQIDPYAASSYRSVCGNSLDYVNYCSTPGEYLSPEGFCVGC